MKPAHVGALDKRSRACWNLVTRCRFRAGKFAYIITGLCRYHHRHLQIRAWADAYICVVGIEKLLNR